MRCKQPLAVAGVGLVALFGSISTAAAQSAGAAASFAVTGAAGVTAAGGAGTVVNGDVGASPTASITGFPPAVVVPPFALHANDAAAIAAQGAAVALYTTLGAGACTTTPTAQMSGASFGPGVHCFSSAADLAMNSTMTLTGAGVYIFRVPSALTANVGSTVNLAGVDPCSVFWQVGSAATLNGVNFPGTVVAQAGVTLGVGARLNGRAFATAGPVTLSGTNIVGGCSAPPAGPPPTPPPATCPAITLAPTTLPPATVAVAYSQAFSATGGTGPYTFAVTSGTLPAGLTLTAPGVLSGTPTTANSYGFVVRGTDANACFQELPYALLVGAAPPPPATCPVITLAPATLPSATTGVAYSQALTASGGTGPYRFGITAGALPAGLTLTAAGVITGTPTGAATSTFTVRATDANGCFREVPLTVVTLSPVPTLSQWAMITLTLLLGLAGVMAMRRRSQYR